MKIGRLKPDNKTIDSAQYTFNKHFIEKDVHYIILSESSGVKKFPIIMQHPIHKHILLVAPPGIDFLESN